MRQLVGDTYADLRGRDIPLGAAGLTFYAAVALVPLLVVACWLAGLILGGEDLRDLGANLAEVVGSRHGLDEAVRRLTDAGTSTQVPALIAAALISTLYGEGLTRALGRLSRSAVGRSTPARTPSAAEGSIGVIRGRLAAPLLVGASGVLVGGGLLLAAWLSSALGSGGKATVFGVYLAFLVCWAGGTANVLLCYLVFGPLRPRFGALLWGAAGAGSWIAGSVLGFLLVLSLPIDLGQPFAGSDALGTAALLIFWLYFSHIAVLLGYAVALRISAGPRDRQDGEAEPGAVAPMEAYGDEPRGQARVAVGG